jgi:hypothetical protein
MPYGASSVQLISLPWHVQARARSLCGHTWGQVPAPSIAGFSQLSITEVFPPRLRGSQVFIAWSSSAPPATWFQVYINHQLAWYGQRTSVTLPMPSGPIRIDIGTVGAGNETTGFATSLPPAPDRCARLAWQGGTFQDPDIAGFHVYGSDTPGGAVDYTNILASITAYPAGITTDGWGLGAYGSGGWGEVAGTYTWTSEQLDGGLWTFAVTPFNAAGNEGQAATVSIQINAPPREPAPFPDGPRLHYSLLAYGQYPYGTLGYGEPQAVLTWNPSP